MPILKEEKLNKFDPSSFDSVKRDVAQGSYEDWKHNTIDEAKKRAIYSSGDKNKNDQYMNTGFGKLDHVSA